MDTMKRLYSIPDAGVVLGDVGRSMVYELIKSGELEVVKIGRRSLVTAESLDAFVERLREGASV